MATFIVRPDIRVHIILRACREAKILPFVVGPIAILVIDLYRCLLHHEPPSQTMGAIEPTPEPDYNVATLLVYRAGHVSNLGSSSVPSRDNVPMELPG